MQSDRHIHLQGSRIIPHLLPFVLVVPACLMVITCVPVLSPGLRDLVYTKEMITG